MPSAAFLRDLDGLRRERLRLLGAALLLKHATTPGSQELARVAVLKTLDIAGMLRARAASLIGTARFPGC